MFITDNVEPGRTHGSPSFDEVDYGICAGVEVVGVNWFLNLGAMIRK